MNDQLNWRKASRSGGQGGNCVEVATLPDGSRLVRDSKNPDGSWLPVRPEQWRTFLDRVKADGI